MIDRKNQLIDFANSSGYKEEDLLEIKNDASFRNYYRLINHNLLIMDADPAKGESVSNFAAIDKLLRSLGFSAPEIISIDVDNGFILLEDFGKKSFTELLSKDNEKDLLKRAVKVLCDLNIKVKSNNKIQSTFDKYSFEKLLAESELFISWYMEKHLNIMVDDKSKNEFSNILKSIYKIISPIQNALVLRDYHVDNLFYLEERDYIRSIGLIDFQDAVRGSTSYDLISILEDVRRPISNELTSELIEYYISETDLNREQTFNETQFFSIQRNLKILGIFCRLNYRDNKSQYLNMIPICNKIIQKHIKAEIYSELRMWLASFNVLFK